jgi:hypothetical protein
MVRINVTLERLFFRETSMISLLLINAVRCYRHGNNEYNLRAKLEDLIEIEKKRSGKDYAKSDAPMTMNDAGRLLNASIQVMRILGWAWRWAEWWVDYNSSWEPLIEPWQKEENMTNEELKKVESTRETRCEDARKCRLAAFGAALRNRLYDDKDGFKNKALEKALRAVLHTESLVGPLSPLEIDFYVDWLGRAYRSQSRLLYFGNDKNMVSNDHEFCIYPDKSLKHELGERPLPGEQEVPEGVVFESNIRDVDNFLQTALLCDLPIMSGGGKTWQRSTRRRRKANNVDENEMDSPGIDQMDASSPRSTPRSFKSDMIDKADVMNIQVDVSSYPERKRKRTTLFNPWEMHDSPVKPLPSGKRRGRPPNPAKKPMTATFSGNFNVVSAESGASATVLNDTIPMATESLVHSSEQDVHHSFRTGSPIVPLTENVEEKPVDLDVAQKPIDHEIDAEVARKASSIGGAVESDLGCSIPVNRTLERSEEPLGTINSAAIAEQSPGNRKDAASANESETLAVASSSRSRVRFRSKLRRSFPAETASHSQVEASEDPEHDRVAKRSLSVDEPVDKFEVVKRRHRRPTRPLTYEHPETYRTDQVADQYDPDDDLPLTELAAKYPAQWARAHRHAARKRNIHSVVGLEDVTPAASAERCDDVTAPARHLDQKSPLPRRRGRQRGKIRAAEEL